MLVYLNYPTSLNKLSLNESTKVNIGCSVPKNRPHYVYSQSHKKSL